MLIHPTIEQLRQPGLAGMARAFEELAANTRGAELDHAEWLGLRQRVGSSTTPSGTVPTCVSVGQRGMTPHSLDTPL